MKLASASEILLQYILASTDISTNIFGLHWEDDHVL